MAEKKFKNPYREYTDATDTGADKLILSAGQQAGIGQAKIDWQKARDAGDQTGMDAAHKRAEEIRAQAGYSGGANGGAYNPFAVEGGARGVHSSPTHMTSPQWTPTYAAERADTVSKIKSRAPFSYDPEKDPTYQQYKQQYERGAAKAMEDTMGQVMARTGGLASSFAQTAGQQSYNATMAQLADKIPELRQLAYQMYMDEGDRLRSDLQLYDSLDSSDASRWQATVLYPFQTDRDYAKALDDTLYSRGQDALNRQWQEKLFDTEREDVAYDRAQAEKKEQEARDLALAELLATGGIYTGYGKSFGMSQAEMDVLSALWREDRDYSKKSADLDLQQKVAQIAATNRSNRGNSGGRSAAATKTEKPVLTYDQTMKAIEAGNITPNVEAAYEYYMGEPYQKDTPSGGNQEMPAATYMGITRRAQQMIQNGGVENAIMLVEANLDSMSENQAVQLRKILGLD